MHPNGYYKAIACRFCKYRFLMAIPLVPSLEISEAILWKALQGRPVNRSTSSSNKRLLKEPIKPKNATRAIGGLKQRTWKDIDSGDFICYDQPCSIQCNLLARDGESSPPCPDSLMPKCQTATKKHGKHHAWEAIGNDTYPGQHQLDPKTPVLKTRLWSACRRNRVLQ